MRILFYTGWLLLVCAFVSAAAEQIVRLYPGAPIILTPALDLWYTLWPGNLTVTQIRVERISPILWDPVITTILIFPAWFLFALPGVLLAWFCRPNRVLTASEQEDHRRYVETLFLYDELAKDSKKQGHSTGPDDMSPNHGGHDILDEIERTPVPSDDELLETIIAEEEAGEDKRETDETPPKSG